MACWYGFGNGAGSVVVDLAAERGGSCELTAPDQKIISDNGVTVIGYTDFPPHGSAVLPYMPLIFA